MNDTEFDSEEVYELGELVGYVLVEVRKPTVHLTPIRCCRTCAWADRDKLVYRAGYGYAFTPKA